MFASGAPAERVENAASPDLFAVIDAGAAHGFKGFAVLPIGIVADGIETMWTLDILAADKVLGQDMEFARARVANDDPLLIEALGSAVEDVL